MTDDTIGHWLNAAGRVPLLTAAEEVHLSQAIRRWQDWEGGPDAAPAQVRLRGLRARERMVAANLRLVVSVANKYRSRITARHQCMSDALAARRLGSLDLSIGEGDGSTLADVTAAPAEDPLEDLAAEQLVAVMRQRLPDDIALVELTLEHGTRALAPLLGCSRTGVAYRRSAAVARLRRLGC